MYRYVTQNPEISYYVFCDHVEEPASSSCSITESNFAAVSYGNGFTPINPCGTIVIWQGLHGTIRDYQQQLTSTLPPQPQSDRSDNSPFMNLILSQAPQKARIYSHTTHLPSESQMTHMSETFPQPRRDRSGNLLAPLRPLQARPAQITSTGNFFRLFSKL